MARHHIMTSVKNEAIYLLEWVAHHRALGFDQVFVAANNCTDGTVALLRELDAAGFAKFAHNKCPPDKIPQHEGYKLLRKRFDVDHCDWLMILDADEFLCVEVGDGSIGALTDATGDDVDIIALNSLTFGTAPDPTTYDLVTKRFQYRLPAEDRLNKMIKSITRDPARFRDAHNHHLMKLTPPARLRVMRADGSTYVIATGVTRLFNYLRNSRDGEITQEMAFYNHYSIKSMAEYALRKKRGNGAVPLGSTPKQRYSDAYFENRAGADILDQRIAKYEPGTRAIIAEMLAVPAIRELQARIEKRFFDSIAKTMG